MKLPHLLLLLAAVIFLTLALRQYERGERAIQIQRDTLHNLQP